MRRRDFIQASTGAASTYIYSMVSSEPRAMHAALNKARRPLPQLDHFEKTAEALGVDVVMTTPTDLLDTALISFQKARTLTGQCMREADRIRLFRANAQLATVVGEILFNINQFDKARQWYLTARRTAMEVGDTYLADTALAGLAYPPTYSEDPRGVLSLISPRLETKTTDNPATAWLWAFCGKAFATIGDRNRAEGAFDKSESALHSSPPGSIRAGIFSFLPQKLNMYKAHAFVTLRRPVQAVESAQQALSMYDPHETTEPSLARFELASALLQAGDVDEACKHATEAVAGPNVYPGVTVRRRAESFTAEIPNRRNPAVRDWLDTLYTVTA